MLFYFTFTQRQRTKDFLDFSRLDFLRLTGKYHDYSGKFYVNYIFFLQLRIV